MTKWSPKKVLFHGVKVAFVILAGLALVLSMMPYGMFF
jgi:hypothetical protein